MAPVELPVGVIHRAHRRAVLPMAAGQKTLSVETSARRSSACASRCAVAPSALAAHQPGRRRSGSSRSFPPSPRCSSRSAPDRRSSAVSSFDTYPPEVKQLPRVGALLDPELERILSLKPDLVVVYGSQTDLKQQLARASIPIFDYRHAGLADVPTTIRTLGERTGHAGRRTRS